MLARSSPTSWTTLTRWGRYNSSNSLYVSLSSFHQVTPNLLTELDHGPRQRRTTRMKHPSCCPRPTLPPWSSPAEHYTLQRQFPVHTPFLSPRFTSARTITTHLTSLRISPGMRRARWASPQRALYHFRHNVRCGLSSEVRSSIKKVRKTLNVGYISGSSRHGMRTRS